MSSLHGGVVNRRALLQRGIGRFDIRNEVAAGRWHLVGHNTVAIGTAELSVTARWWCDLWETCTGAVLDGATALVASGLEGFTPSMTEVSVPQRVRFASRPGVRVTVRRELNRTPRSGLPRTTVEVATIRAAQLAVSDRQAALLICLPVQQRLTTAARLLAAWLMVRRSPRRALIDPLIRDVCDGAQSLGELDFTQRCRMVGLPAPVRQSLQAGANGRIYLDVRFANGLVVEIDGAHHLVGLNPVDDALRANGLTLDSDLVLRIPVLGLRVAPEAFMSQVVRAHQLANERYRR